MRRALLLPLVLACGSEGAGDVHDSGPDVQDTGTDAPDASPVRPGIMIPLYTYPTDGTWAALITAQTAHTTVPIVAIINPASGPGPSQNADYVTGITNLEAAGVTVIGYVPTGYGTHSYSAVSIVEQAVKDYVTWYPNIEGIFFDEMSTDAGEQSYYRTLASYVASQNLSFTVGNPGTTVPMALVGIFTNLVIYENQGVPSTGQVGAFYPNTAFTYIAYGVSSLSSSSVIQGLNHYVTYGFFTDLGGSNPYGALPSYFASEVAAF